MEADTWATCTARLEAGELGDWTDPRTNTPSQPPLARASRTRRHAASAHQRSVSHTKRRPGATKLTLISSRVLPPRSLDPTHDRSMKASAPRPQKALRSPGDKFALDVGPSTIDGHGCFAAEPIPARRKIGEIRGQSLTVKEARLRAKSQRRIMMVEVSARTAIDASQSTHPLRFTNHSCRPSAELRIVQGRIELYSLRDLAAGEEITANYGETHHEGRLRCRCGAPGCVGRI